MKLTFLRGECWDNRSCPNVNLTDRSTYVVQGYTAGESTVEIPLSLVPELIDEVLGSNLRVTDRNTILVDGLPVTDPEALQELNLPEGESAVEVPIDSLPLEVGVHAR